jgi:hypothetical protein
MDDRTNDWLACWRLGEDLAEGMCCARVPWTQCCSAICMTDPP